MLKFRAIRKSIYDFTVSLFESPPPDTGWSDWNVYGEDQLRQWRGGDGDFTPVDPYIFIVDSYIAPTRSELPLVVIEATAIAVPYQLGDPGGKTSVGRLHVFGRNRGQRDDIAAMFQEVLSYAMTTSGSVVPIPIYDYHSSGSETFVETAHVDPGVDIAPMGIGSEEVFEASVLNWNTVTFSFHTKS